MKTFSEYLNESAKKQSAFNNFPEYNVGAILYTSGGHSMIIIKFYQIIKRSDKTIYVQEIEQKVVSGNAKYSGEVIGIKDAFKKNSEVITAKLPNPRIKNHYGYLWDGRPNYFDYTDTD